MYNKIKKQNGEAFAQTLRNYHNGLLEIANLDEIVRHAGRDAAPLLPYLMSLLASNDDRPQQPSASLDPFALLDQGDITPFTPTRWKSKTASLHTSEKENCSAPSTMPRAIKNYHIIHAVRKDVDSILRDDFNGKEERQDAYGTSVISIQMCKEGGFISIKNRYNHTVAACDNTFDSNPDNIIKGLSAALKNHFGVDFEAAKSPLPDDFTLIGNRIFKYHRERNNIYYGDQAYARNGQIHTVDKSTGDALFGVFLFENKTRTLTKIDPNYNDSFAENLTAAMAAIRG